MDAIFDRHSVRMFSKRPVDDEDLRKIILAGCAAPSSKNDQPWRIIIAKQPRLASISKELLEASQSISVSDVAENCKATFSIMGGAPVCIFVFLEKDASSPRYVPHVQSVGAFIENMCIEAKHIGLGTLWCCDILETEEAMKKALHSERCPIAAVMIGYDAGNTPRKKHKVPEDLIIKGYDE